MFTAPAMAMQDVATAGAVNLKLALMSQFRLIYPAEASAR
jgi:hypothetical protein